LLFNSYEFIFVFLPITFFIYFYLNHKRFTEASKVFLVFSSLFFYSWWNITYLPIILSSILFNYIIGTSLNKEQVENHHRFSKKLLLTFGIVSNIALLSYFKYMDFFIENINLVSGSNYNLLYLALPLAISFFTFQQIAYLVDSYRQKIKEYNFLNYSLFVTFFPQLIAGPIVHHSEMIPQFAKTKNKVKNYRNIAMGLFIFSIGLFKKVVIADTFAVWATQGFDVATTLNLFEAWATSLSYTFQLYFDFSGYTDMAIGIALLFNIKLPINFNSPYKATSIQDFWNRWHITLSRFVNMYIFKPIVKSYKQYTFTKGMMALFMSMVIIGFWHGSSWLFILFGAMHGIAITINHIWKKKIKIKIHQVLGWFLTFNFVNISLIFFRAKEWDDVVKILSGMINITETPISKEFINFFNYINPISIYFDKFKGVNFNTFISVNTLEMLILGFILITYTNSNEMAKKGITFSLYILSIFSFGTALIVMSLQTGSEFLYFNF